MVMTARDIRAWIETVPDDAEVGINDDGMCLEVVGSDAYLEVGGLPLPEARS